MKTPTPQISNPQSFVRVGSLYVKLRNAQVLILLETAFITLERLHSYLLSISWNRLHFVHFFSDTELCRQQISTINTNTGQI